MKLEHIELERLSISPLNMRAKADRREVTSALRNYLDLHRHAAVRARLLEKPNLAFRLMLAHAITSSGLWSVRSDPQRSDKPPIAESVERSRDRIALRNRSALTQGELVDLLDLSQSTLSEMELLAETTRLETALALQVIFGTRWPNASIMRATVSAISWRVRAPALAKQALMSPSA